MKCENDLMEDFFYNVRGKMVRIKFFIDFLLLLENGKFVKNDKGVENQ